MTRTPVCVTPQQTHIMAERSVLLKNVRHPFLVGLRYSFQTPEKLYFVLDYVNGGEVGGPAGSSPGLTLSCGLSIPYAHCVPGSGMFSPPHYNTCFVAEETEAHLLKVLQPVPGRARIGTWVSIDFFPQSCPLRWTWERSVLEELCA